MRSTRTIFTHFFATHKTQHRLPCRIHVSLACTFAVQLAPPHENESMHKVNFRLQKSVLFPFLARIVYARRLDVETMTWLRRKQGETWHKARWNFIWNRTKHSPDVSHLFASVFHVNFFSLASPIMMIYSKRLWLCLHMCFIMKLSCSYDSTLKQTKHYKIIEHLGELVVVCLVQRARCTCENTNVFKLKKRRFFIFSVVRLWNLMAKRGRVEDMIKRSLLFMEVVCEFKQASKEFFFAVANSRSRKNDSVNLCKENNRFPCISLLHLYDLNPLIHHKAP